MSKKILFGSAAFLLALNLFFGTQIHLYSAQSGEKENPYEQYRVFTEVLEKVRQDYVDGTNLTYKELIHGALKGMLGTLDPHSEFMPPVAYKDLKDDTQGEFSGVGIVVSVSREKFLTVVAPMDDSPGYKAGILPGDRIVKIDGKNAEKLPLDEAVKRLRGKTGTDVTLTLFRASNGETKDYKLVRETIRVSTIKDHNGRSEFPLISDKTGYVRISQFGEQTASDLEVALQKLEKNGMQSLVLDLRGNPGGLLEQAGQVAEKFLPRGQLVVSTEGRGATQKSEYRSRTRNQRKLPIVVLVNGGSASAAEIVAGCLQDLQSITHAVVIGEQTFGKGSVQSILPLPDGSALRLTTAKYYTPSHKVIHEKGITPDIIVPMSDEDERALALQRSLGGTESLDDAERDRVRAVRDVQLDRAVDLLKGLSVFTQRLEPAGIKKVADAAKALSDPKPR